MARATSGNVDLGLTPEQNAEIKERGRWLRRVANPFVDFYKITAIGADGSPTTAEAVQRRNDKLIRNYSQELRVAGTHTFYRCLPFLPHSTAIQRKIHTDDFDQIISILPFLKDRLESADTSQVIRKVIHVVQSVADKAKQSDTKNIKLNIITLIPQRYLPPDENGNKTTNAHQHINIRNPGITKSWRGWNNQITSRLLCPIDCITQFDENPAETMEKLAQGTVALNDNAGDPKFPAFLYDEDTLDGSLTTGLFRGPLLLAVYISIFISPSGATGAKSSSKRGNAKIHGMESIVPSTICYAAIHAYMALCCRQEWGEEWKGVKLPRLYILLREQFAHQDDPWCVETVKWWNEKIFNGSAETEENSLEATRDTQGPSMRERMENERQERMRPTATTN